MRFFARPSLVSAGRSASADASYTADRAGVLLEGSWPADGSTSGRWSLDDAIDGRFAWIDAEACQTATRVCHWPGWRLRSPAGDLPLAWLNAPRLRYHLVKLLRLAAFLDAWAPGPFPESIELFVERDRDEDYADLIGQWARRRRIGLVVWWSNGARRANGRPATSIGRGWLARLNAWTMPAANAENPRQRVVLCGNPALLDPVCHELLARDARVWWLTDRFAGRLWRRWRTRGVGQLSCDVGGWRSGIVMDDSDRSPLPFGDFDLADCVRRWLRRCAVTNAPDQGRLIERIAGHLTKVRPRALVLDQDATPLARAAVAIARRLGIRSFVAQHGAPYGRFGFAPLAADRLLAWGETSRRRFHAWGIPAEKIIVTGSPRHDALIHGQRDARVAVCGPQRIVLLATLPPADDRPDLVAFHLNAASHRQMLRMACSVLARRPGIELIVKPHPRCQDDAVFRSVVAEFPDLPSRIVRGDDQTDVLAGAACALSCGSSAGVESALRGVPAIELLPAGSAKLLPPADWGFLGAARDGEQLARLLDAALASPPGSVQASARVFGNLDRSAAAKMADVVLAGEAAALRVEESSTQPDSSRGTGRMQVSELIGGPA
jgi:hypothetical protein